MEPVVGLGELGDSKEVVPEAAASGVELRVLGQGGKRVRRRARVVVKATSAGAGGTDRARLKIRLRR